ncbi:MAG: DUF4886 domain-containing protein [Clostridia bacterium]|nr:DUF4886 domain-containing protein [Clostridia bacterium]
MKKLLALLLAVAMLTSLCACGAKPGKNGPTDNTTATTSETATTEGTTTTTFLSDGSTLPPSATETSATATTAATTSGGTEPSSTKPTSAIDTEEEVFRVLAIGDDCALDAVENYLYALLGTQYSKVQLGVLYAAKSDLDTHYEAVKNNKATYEFRVNTNGKWQKTANVSADNAFLSAQWDAVVLQQNAATAGVDTAYGNLSKLTALVQEKCPDAAIYWHMTWAFQQGCKQEGFQQYYNNQQMMFQSIVSTTLKRVVPDDNVTGLIPTATTIQNLRTSSLQDNLTSDGRRLTADGDYAAALTWYCCLTGEPTPDAAKGVAHYDLIKEAVDNALSVPNAITPAAAGDGVERSIRILAVGNSFSIDAMTQHLYAVLQAGGYDDIRLGILYVGGCSLDMHYGYLSADSASYEYMENLDGKWTNTKNYKASDAFALTDWDYVVIQQVSGQSGRPDTYGKLDAVIDLIRPQIGKAKLYWQMTWAYQQDSTHGDFAHYGKDQTTMYNAIVNTVKEKILTHPDIDGVIPSGTAIQNLRTSALGDTLTADGYHLENDVGDYTAALTWFATLTGKDPFSMFYYPAGAIEHFYDIAEAVENAVAHPWQVTAATNT